MFNLRKWIRPKIENEERNVGAGAKDGDAFTSSCISVASVRDGWLVRASRVASRREEKGWKGREEEKGCEGRRERKRENERMVVEALSTGSLGHSYASAVGTISARPCLLHKTLLHVHSNTTSTHASPRINCSTTRGICVSKNVILWSKNTTRRRDRVKTRCYI